MCLAPGVIDERISHLNALLTAARRVMVANAQPGSYFAADAVLTEVQNRLSDLGGELKACAKTDDHNETL